MIKFNKNTFRKYVYFMSLVSIIFFLVLLVSLADKNEYLNSKTGDTVNAYQDAISGDDTKLSELGIYTSVSTLIPSIVNNYSSQGSELNNILKEYYNNFTIKMIDEKSYIDEFDGKEKVKFMYSISVYDYVQVFDEMTSDKEINKYLDNNEVDIFFDQISYTSEEKKFVLEKFYSQYYENLRNLEPEERVYYAIVAKDSNGVYDFEQQDFKKKEKQELVNLYSSVIGKNMYEEIIE